MYKVKILKNVEKLKKGDIYNIVKETDKHYHLLVPPVSCTNNIGILELPKKYCEIVLES